MDYRVDNPGRPGPPGRPKIVARRAGVGSVFRQPGIPDVGHESARCPTTALADPGVDLLHRDRADVPVRVDLDESRGSDRACARADDEYEAAPVPLARLQRPVEPALPKQTVRLCVDARDCRVAEAVAAVRAGRRESGSCGTDCPDLVSARALDLRPCDGALEMLHLALHLARQSASFNRLHDDSLHRPQVVGGRPPTTAIGSR
jgi:hypothetical protein